MPPWASWQLRKSGKSAPPPSSGQEEVARVWGHLAKANFFSVFFWAFFSKMWMQKGVSKNYSSVTVKRHLLELLIDQEVWNLEKIQNSNPRFIPQTARRWGHWSIPTCREGTSSFIFSPASTDHGIQGGRGTWWGKFFFEDLIETGEV